MSMQPIIGKKFQRRTEDFDCERCGFTVVGNGYTNHCPKCLWSKHVDIRPGDREASCQGLMEPVFLESVDGEQKLTHRCVVCGYEKKNKVGEEDDFEMLLGLAKSLASKS